MTKIYNSDRIAFFLNTEVKGKNIQPVEKVANFCLTPVRFLWNGRKVELIQQGQNKAIQYEHAYTASERSDYNQFFLMVVLVIPGAVVGIVLKLYAYHKYHDKKEDESILRELKFTSYPYGGCLGLPGSDRHFCNFVQGFLQTIKIMYPKKGDSLVFLSEIETLTLHKPTSVEQINQRNIRHNQEVLNNLGLLWNLKVLVASGHYDYLASQNQQNIIRSFEEHLKGFRKELPELTMRV